MQYDREADMAREHALRRCCAGSRHEVWFALSAVWKRAKTARPELLRCAFHLPLQPSNDKSTISASSRWQWHQLAAGQMEMHRLLTAVHRKTWVFAPRKAGWKRSDRSDFMHGLSMQESQRETRK